MWCSDLVKSVLVLWCVLHRSLDMHSILAITRGLSATIMAANAASEYQEWDLIGTIEKQ
jgi:hypothetical protein